MALKKEMVQKGNSLFKHRGSLPVIVLVAGLVIHGYQEFGADIQTMSHDQNNLYLWICFFISLLGLLVRIFTIGFTHKHTSGRNRDNQVAEKLNKKGMYSIVRHPLYLGNFIIYLGISMIVQNLWFTIIYILIFWIYYERIMMAEEAFLQNKFGKSYKEWSKDIPPFLPKFKNYQRPENLTFSFSEVFKREYNGLASIILVFFIFNLIPPLINQKPELILSSEWTYMTLAAAFMVVIFKILRKTVYK